MKKGKSRLNKNTPEKRMGYVAIGLVASPVLCAWLMIFGQGNINRLPENDHNYNKQMIIYKEPEKALTQEQKIQQYIIEVFGKDAMDALAIAKCESGFNPSREGDGHLTSIDPQYNEVVGDSIGVFQIRVGGDGWNRARANGKSAERFRQDLKSWKYNIDYAKSIYDRAGDWHDWHNCSIKTGLN